MRQSTVHPPLSLTHANMLKTTLLLSMAYAKAFIPSHTAGVDRRIAGLAAQKGDTIEFAKYEGLGNDFILIDDRDRDTPSLTPEQSERLCHRNFGIGGDGVIFALKAPEGKKHNY